VRYAALIILLGAAWPMAIAWQATAATTLRSSLLWAAVAWAAWLAALATGTELATYTALGLSGCAGVAVLGARRPGVGAWNFVVAGLLAVFLLPVAQGWGTPRIETIHVAFLGATLAVPVLNYLPTRLAAAFLLCGVGCATQLARIAAMPLAEWQLAAGQLCLAAGPWVGLLVRRTRRASSAFDQVWVGFREKFGFVWAQRSREQFNRAAGNAGWSARLRWHGLARVSEGVTPHEADLLRTLGAVLKRFGPEVPQEHQTSP
jgi:hypothetical protein